MSTGELQATDERGVYIRGAGVQVDSRRVTRVVVGLCVVALAALVVALAVAAVAKNSRLSRLQDHGTAVDVTVTGCRGMASGTGITASGFRCHGSFVLDGRRYDEVIGGTTQLYAVGQTLSAVTDPGQPATLSTADAVATAPASWKAFIAPGILLLVLLMLLALILRRARRQPGRDLR